ncbi:MAG: hypothetical protein E7290_04170 [Lachnospiraceae bacterium]|nr:hypothetical protein [Lachnospiraceae bacterium]
MAFVGEWIEREEDKKYIASKGFTYITGKEMTDAGLGVIDRERDIILVPRGGGGLDMPESYGLYLDGFLIDMEGHKRNEGTRFKNNLKVHWYITWIGVPKTWFEANCSVDKLKQVITEAFTAYAYIDLKASQVLEVTVDISVDPVEKLK